MRNVIVRLDAEQAGLIRLVALVRPRAKRERKVQDVRRIRAAYLRLKERRKRQQDRDFFLSFISLRSVCSYRLLSSEAQRVVCKRGDEKGPSTCL